MADIPYLSFRRLDLNLLVAFDALLAEASVSRAAARLCVGQPAMSHALARLRELFDDDILYRDGSGMRPTARALALAPRIRAVLTEMLAVTQSAETFDPAQAVGEFRVALNDPLEALLLPGLMARLRARSPSLTLAVRPIPASQQLEQLDQGAIGLAVGYFPKVREVHEVRLLYRSGFSCVYNPALLQLPGQPSLESMALYPHIHTTYTGDGPGLVDVYLQQAGLRRHVVAQTASPLSIPFVVKQSPLLAILPDLVANLFKAHADLCIEPLALPGLELPVSMVIHRRDHSDPLTRYVADQVEAAAQTLFAGAA
ncbi:MAG: LysR family transcriptional regulator [Rhodocyclales bacterium GT-UBC]|nr:MAG: LysR family transcriptional regulator [Rhodocyclales bacterium GT-UBC]